MLNFLKPNDPKLKGSCNFVPVDKILNSETQTFIKQFLLFCGAEARPDNKGKITRMVGCAAPQVGVMKNIIVVNTAIHPEKRNFHEVDFHVLINPKIIWSSQSWSQYPESCFSIPLRFTGIIKRPIEIVVDAYNEKGIRVIRRYENYTARIVQHEIDHLHGIRFPQRTKSIQDIHLIKFNRREDLLNYRVHWHNFNLYPTEVEYQQLKEGCYDSQ